MVPSVGRPPKPHVRQISSRIDQNLALQIELQYSTDGYLVQGRRPSASFADIVGHLDVARDGKSLLSLMRRFVDTRKEERILNTSNMIGELAGSEPLSARLGRGRQTGGPDWEQTLPGTWTLIGTTPAASGVSDRPTPRGSSPRCVAVHPLLARVPLLTHPV